MQRDKIISKQINDKNILEIEKRKKYNSKDLFNNKSLDNDVDKNKTDTSANTLPVVYKNNVFSKLIIFIKRLFK